MSATNRGAVRCEADRYITPEWAIRSFLENLTPKKAPRKIIEPCAGNGAIVKVLAETYTMTDIIAVEMRPKEKTSLKNAGAHHVAIGNFLKFLPWMAGYPDLIISNPPYSLAQEVIEHSIKLSGPECDIVMLLRLNFFGSQERKEFWDKHPAQQLYPLSKRPSFGTHCKCPSGHKHFYGLDQVVPNRCPECGEKWKSKTTTDATDYGWFIWSNWRPPLIKVI